MAGIDTQIVWGNITLQGDRSQPCDYLLTDLTGWEDWTGVRQTVDRPNQHGVYAAPVFVREKQIVATGYCRTPGERDQLFSALGASMSLPAAGGTEQPITISNAGRTLTAQAALSAFDPMSDVRNLWGRDVFGWKIAWLQSDPRRYGPAQSASTGLALPAGGLEYDLFTDGTTDTGFLEFGPYSTSGQVQVSNPGTTDAAPLFQITGPLDNCQISRPDTNQTLDFTGSVPAGSVLTIDAATATVLLDGAADRSSLLSPRQWWDVPPGQTVTVNFATRGALTTAQLTVTVEGTYL